MCDIKEEFNQRIWRIEYFLNDAYYSISAKIGWLQNERKEEN